MAYPQELWQAVDSLTAVGKRPIIAIDGPAGSGKTTLAQQIQSRIHDRGQSSTTVHMDDLYHGWDDALTPSLTSKLIALTTAHTGGEELILHRFDWLASTFTEPTRSPSTDFLILEGVGSSQRPIRNSLALIIWIESNPEAGIARVLAREPGIEVEQMREWQIREREHFARDESKVAANIEIST